MRLISAYIRMRRRAALIFQLEILRNIRNVYIDLPIMVARIGSLTPGSSLPVIGNLCILDNIVQNSLQHTLVKVFSISY